MTKKSKIILNAVLTILLLIVMFTQFVFYGNPISKIWRIRQRIST